MRIRLVSAVTLLSMAALVSSCARHSTISVEKIQNDIVGMSTGDGLMSWTFSKEEPRKISTIESKYKGNAATIIISMTTEDVGGVFGKTKMAGRLRLNYEWIAGEWNLVRVEALTFKEVE